MTDTDKDAAKAGHASNSEADRGVDPASRQDAARPVPPKHMPKEIGGPAGPEPTRYGDWEQKGRCTDF